MERTLVRTVSMSLEGEVWKMGSLSKVRESNRSKSGISTRGEVCNLEEKKKRNPLYPRGDLVRIVEKKTKKHLNLERYVNGRSRGVQSLSPSRLGKLQVQKEGGTVRRTFWIKHCGFVEPTGEVDSWAEKESTGIKTKGNPCAMLEKAALGE